MGFDFGKEKKCMYYFVVIELKMYEYWFGMFGNDILMMVGLKCMYGFDLCLKGE